jgi:NADPH-ferrihemoprotein reductase
MTAVVVRYSHPQKHIKGGKSEKVVLKEGLATSFLERLHDERTHGRDYKGELNGTPPFHLPVYIRTSNFRLPKNLDIPVVMVGPGTGVAPFRAFVRERFLAASKGQVVGPTWLFYGCRNEESDYLYKEEFEDMLNMVKENALDIDLRIITAFSRDGKQKVYVQHRFKEHASTVWDMLHHSKGCFYICGYFLLI